MKPLDNSQDKNLPSLRNSDDIETDPGVDMDALHIFTFVNSAVRNLRFETCPTNKNVQLDSVLELFSGKTSGSGQVEISKIETVFDLSDEKGEIDKSIIEQLSNINSYDVYTLRISLRNLNIPVNDLENLQLTESKNDELVKYMTDFTKPLMINIYGSDEKYIKNIDELLDMFKTLIKSLL